MPVEDYNDDNLINDKHEPVPTKKKTNPPPPITPKLGPIKILPNGIQATNWNYRQKVYEDDSFSFHKLDINIRTEGEDYTAYTFGQYKINGNCKTEWTTYNRDTLYQVHQGEGWFMIGDEGKTLETGYLVCVPKDTRHCILNQSRNIPCLVNLYFPGKIVLE